MEFSESRGRLKEHYIRLGSGFTLIAICVLLALPSPAASQPPYPPSHIIGSVTWDFSGLVRFTPGSDLWPVTWAADNHLYASWGDGGGFGGDNNSGRVSLGFARIEGGPTDFVGYNVWGGKAPENPAKFDGKAAGMLSIDGTLYAWINMQNGSPPDFRLTWSSDFGANWQLASWAFPKSDSFFPSTFLNFGKDYSGARDEFVYMYGAKWIWTQGQENNLYLVRAPKSQLRQREVYEFFAGLNPDGTASWTSDVGQRQPVFTDPNGVGNIGLAHVVFNPGIGRYILTVGHRPPGSDVKAEVQRLGIFEAPEPWGPWATVEYYEDWGSFGSGEMLGYDFPTKWISADGRTMWMIFSSTGILDSFNLVKATFTLKTGTDTTPPAMPTNLAIQ